MDMSIICEFVMSVLVGGGPARSGGGRLFRVLAGPVPAGGSGRSRDTADCEFSSSRVSSVAACAGSCVLELSLSGAGSVNGG